MTVIEMENRVVIDKFQVWDWVKWVVDIVIKDHMKYLYVSGNVLHLDYQYQYPGGDVVVWVCKLLLLEKCGYIVKGLSFIIS